MKHARVYRAAAVVLAVLLCLPAARAQAASYRDVPRSHYAYDAVDWVSDPANGSFMVGDAANNFNPARTLDKFDAAKIIAMAAGYKYAANSISPAEQELFDRSYAEWRSLLDNMAAQYARWSKNADREIAYLLHKNILTVTDVGRFVTKTGSVETVAPLTKQDAIVFMIRLDGKQSLADNIVLPYHTPYRDDHLIQADYKKHLYYAKETGLAGGSDGYINPTRDFTRAEMAQMFYNMLAYRAAPPTPSPGASGVSGANVTVSGVIDYVFADTQLYVLADGMPRLFKLTGSTAIMVDNAPRAAGFLKPGMSVTALVNASHDAVSVVARTAVAAAPLPTAAPVTITPTAVPITVPPSAGLTLYEDEGYVSATSGAGEPTVSVRAQRVKLTGEIVSEEKTYSVSPQAVIRRGESAVTFSDIKANDIIVFKHNGYVMHEINLEEKDRRVIGTLTEKKAVAGTTSAVFTIEDARKVKYELRVTAETRFTRGAVRNLTWNDLRVGDAVEAECEYDRIVTAYATGTRSTANGKLEEIRLAANVHQVTLRKDDGSTAVYNLPVSVYDAYSLRIGMQLRLYLDSWEIYGIDIL